MKHYFKFAIIIMAVISIAGCVESYDGDDDIAFPSKFIGTWERAYDSPYSSTLTFTSSTVKASNQSSYWEIYSISGDVYTIKYSKNNKTASLVIRLNNDNLEIIDNDVDISDSENVWTGTWKRQ